jgi:hypothetical protein
MSYYIKIQNRYIKLHRGENTIIDNKSYKTYCQKIQIWFDLYQLSPRVYIGYDSIIINDIYKHNIYYKKYFFSSYEPVSS